MRRYGGAVALLVLLGGCGSTVDPLTAASGLHHVVLLKQRGLRVGVARDEAGQLCFTYVGTRHGGGRCMVATGWSFEVAAADPGPVQVLMVAADPRTAEVRIPRTDGGLLVVRPARVAGVDANVAVVAADLGVLRLGGNLAEAFDADGRLLGHTHDCSGLGGPADCGPWTGLIDAAIRPPAPPA